MTQQCPKSTISGTSLAWLEEYTAWKTLGGARLYEMPARTVDAFLVLENEVRVEAGRRRGS